MLVVGVDGCKTGWIAISLGDRKDPEGHYLPTIDALESLASEADAVAIDMPIGLPAEGVREADRRAREFLGARRNSVFLTPVRDAIEAQTHALATQAAVIRTGSGVSQQAYALGKKILEVERWLPHRRVGCTRCTRRCRSPSCSGPRRRLRRRPVPVMVERRRALEAAGVSLDSVGAESFAAARASVDDMLDATVAAWSAARIARGAARSFPDPPQIDASGRRMAVWA